MKIKVQITETIERDIVSEIELPNGMDAETFIKKINEDDSECLTLFWNNAIYDVDNSDTINQTPYEIRYEIKK